MPILSISEEAKRTSPHPTRIDVNVIQRSYVLSFVVMHILALAALVRLP